MKAKIYAALAIVLIASGCGGGGGAGAEAPPGGVAPVQWDSGTWNNLVWG